MRYVIKHLKEMRESYERLLSADASALLLSHVAQTAPYGGANMQERGEYRTELVDQLDDAIEVLENWYP